jgi:hypothetical protein
MLKKPAFFPLKALKGATESRGAADFADECEIAGNPKELEKPQGTM